MKPTLFKLLFALTINFLFHLPLKAQELSVSGTVTDAGKKPLDYATVSVLTKADSSVVKTMFTNDKGHFNFRGLKESEYFVSVSSVGFKKFTGKSFSLSSQNPQFHVEPIQLQPESRELKEVSITAQKPFIERKADKLIVNVENSSVSVGSTALEVLQKAPGVSVDKDDNIALKGQQGVMIMVDGKQTYMSNADLANFLRNMQSNEIESIEIINNPSARYEAAGKAGIINIKLKKNKSYGTNGTLNAGGGYGKRYKSNAGISFNNRNKTVNIFGSYNYSNNKRFQDMKIDRINSDAGKNTYFYQFGNSDRKNQDNNFKLGADYFIDKNNTIGALMTGYINNGGELYGNNTLIGATRGANDSSVVALNEGNYKYRNFSYNVNLKSVLDTSGQELQVDLDYSNYYGNDNTLYDNIYYYNPSATNGNPELLRNHTPSKIHIYSVKADYTYPLSKRMKLETGLKSSMVKTDNNFQFNRFLEEAWQNDPRRSNHFIYDENINAAYINYRIEWKKTTLQAGLRGEQTNSKGNLVTTDSVVNRHYFNLFPSGVISHNFTDNHTIGLSYSRRINRPSYDALNPFEYYLDKYTYNQGNPFLKPEYTNAFELSYTYKKAYTVSFGYNITNDLITEVLLPNPQKGALYQTNQNLAKQNAYSATVSAPFTFTKWWSSNNNINIFYLGFKTPNLNGQEIDNGKTAFQIYSSQNIKLGKTTSLELNGDYQSSLIYGTIKIEPQYGIDMGLSQSLYNKKLNVKLALNDVFNTRTQKISSAYPGLSYSLSQKRETQVVRLSLSYRFGSNEIKASRQRSTGLESEANRIKK
ncbi:TonB-dependent receptor domain-containing protein [Pararcticibacter amylolyticus]|uniref:TonB-dependent receptor n=1 Tax=Pararcticibacter amylolyticus TaxID=2173175 RepID=A0A2U2PMZ1_9SPHI|nr:TonB-dependent receptor [Pararcticibacter amylolyticus]PWG82664.1 TonB-dependent receptor [Pararcticibacter amylolyticus]